MAAPDVVEAPRRRRVQQDYAADADMPETANLVRAFDSWWPEIESFIRTGVTNAKTEAANLTIKNTKRAGQGFTNPANCPATSAYQRRQDDGVDTSLNRKHRAEWPRAA